MLSAVIYVALATDASYVSDGVASFHAGRIGEAWALWERALDGSDAALAHRNLAALRAGAFTQRIGTGVDPLLTKNLTAASEHAREAARLEPSSDATDRVRRLSIDLHRDIIRETHANAWAQFVKDVTFVEIGTANYETITQHVATRGLPWRGVAVEPVPWLAKNLGAVNAMICPENGRGTLRAVRSDDPAILQGDFIPRGMSYNADLFHSDDKNFETLDVPCLRYDTLIQGFDHVDLLKIDVEGSDPAIVHAALDFHSEQQCPLRRIVFESTLDREAYLQPYDAPLTAFASSRDTLPRRLLSLDFLCSCSPDNCDCVHRSVFPPSGGPPGRRLDS